jgi:hypothetical protein
MSDKSHSRGYYGESRIAKLLKGKVVGRSKAILLDSGRTIKIDHQHPCDVVTDLFAVESKYRRDGTVCSKGLSEAMQQAEANTPGGLITLLVIKDPFRKKYMYCLSEKDFIDLHGGA